jgi:hypothetical protein
VKDIHHKAVAMAAYARPAKNRELEADAIEIKMRATRRLSHEPVPRFTCPDIGDKQKLKGSGVRQIVRAAGEAKDDERRGFTSVHTHQDGTASSASAFDRRIRRRRRCGGHRFNKRRWNDLERPL